MEKDGRNASLSLTEMLLKELEVEVTKPGQCEEDAEPLCQSSKDPFNFFHSAVLEEKNEIEDNSGTSFGELIEGYAKENREEKKQLDRRTSLATPRNGSFFPSNTAVPPVPPPLVNNNFMNNVNYRGPIAPVPPPSVGSPFLPTPNSMLPPMNTYPHPMMPNYNPMLAPRGNTSMPMARPQYHNHMLNSRHSNNNNRFNSPLPIPVANLPDTTLATQLKNKKKKRNKKTSDTNANEKYGDEACSPPPLPPSPPPPPSEDLPPLPSELPPPSPSPDKMSVLKRVKEHKLVMKVDKRTVKEPAPVQPIKKKDSLPLVADYESDSDDNIFNNNKKSGKKDIITSVRLGENEALPDLYSKLKKLNEELATLKDKNSSNSDTDDCMSPDRTNSKSFSSKDSDAKANCPQRPNLDVRIKMMMDAPSPVKKPVQSVFQAPASKPALTPASKLALTPASKLPHQKKVQITPHVVPDDPTKPLQRLPSPFLSREIYHYWHKESLKFTKYRKKAMLLYVDPTIRYVFNDSIVIHLNPKVPDEAKLVNPHLLLEKKLKEDIQQQKKTKAILTEELELDLKRLEEINKQLMDLEDEENSPSGSIDLVNEDNSKTNSPVEKPMECNFPPKEVSEEEEKKGVKRKFDEMREKSDSLISSVLNSVIQEIKHELKCYFQSSVIDKHIENFGPEPKKMKLEA